MSRSFVGNIIERKRAYNHRIKNICMHMRKYKEIAAGITWNKNLKKYNGIN